MEAQEGDISLDNNHTGNVLLAAGWLSNSGLPFPLSQSRLHSSQQRIFYLAQISGLHVSILFHHLNCSYLNKKRQRDDRPGTKLKRHRKTGKGTCIRALVPKLLGTRHRFHGRWFFHTLRRGMVFRWFKGITFLVHFIITTSAPHQIIQY